MGAYANIRSNCIVELGGAEAGGAVGPLGDEHAAGPKLQQASLQFSQSLASVPAAMQHWATLLSDGPKPVSNLEP